jgi:hypothetical protein
MEPAQGVSTDAPPAPSAPVLTSTSGGTAEPAVRPSLTEAVKHQKARHAEVEIASWLRELGGRQR